METKLNIVEILKDKPKGTKLYDLLININVKLDNISTTDIDTVVWCMDKTDNTTTRLCGYSEVGTVRGCPDGLQILKPSKEMQDWSKFAWKKGDVLMAGVDNFCIFDKWNNDEYTEFDAAFVTPDYRSDVLKTKYWHEVIGERIIKRYISKIERNYGGKLNLTALEIEKTQPEFKDGDIVVYKCEIDNVPSTIFIFRGINQRTPYYSYYASLGSDGFLSYKLGEFGIYNRELRLATEEEKRQLFDALAEEGKAWDAEMKQIVDLKPKVELKPFDKVLVREDEYLEWQADFFSNIDEDNRFVCIGSTWSFCIPYNEETAKLIGTTNNAK